MRVIGKRTLLWLAAAAAMVLPLALAGCGPSYSPSKPLSQLTPEEMQGRQIFVQECSSCHHANHTGDLHGPSLFAMFRKKYLPSGAPANDDRVTYVIVNGRNMMPGFGNQLSQQQLQALLDYLHTL